MTRTVIVGAGVAGVQTALELRHHGYTGAITLLSDEDEEPYDRPPLSKEYLKGAVEREGLSLLPMRTAKERSIDLRLGARVIEVRTEDQEVVLHDQSVFEYDYLVLATGAHNRPLPVPGADLPGVWSLRGLDEAEALRDALSEAGRVVIVGGGFIGLEVAAAAQAKGAQVTIIEFLPRVMARVLSTQMSEHFAEEHRRRGVDILTGVGVTAIEKASDGSVAAVTLSDGSSVLADIVVVGIGVLPTTELASAAGLDAVDGVSVDHQLRTSNPRVYAVGDCARFNCAVSERELRLESIQNAADQARFVANQIVSQAQLPSSGEVDADILNYRALPWFWTEQYESKLQIAGVATIDADSVVRGDPNTGSFSVCRFDGERLVSVESVNHARDHLGARKLLAADPMHLPRVTRTSVADQRIPLKSLLDS